MNDPRDGQIGKERLLARDRDGQSSSGLPVKALLIVVGLVLVCAVVLTWAIGTHFGLEFVLDSELDKAISTARADREKGQRQINELFAQAIRDKTDPETLMLLYRKYAKFLYEEDEIAAGDEQLQHAIDLGKSNENWKKYQSVAEQLGRTYHDRAWKTHEQWLEGDCKKSGVEEQKLALDLLEKIHGPNSAETIYETVNLALFRSDEGQIGTAEKMIQSCLTTAQNQFTAKTAEWYVYAMLGRMKARQHKYQEAIEAMLSARAAASLVNRDKPWDQLLIGLRNGQSEIKPERALARKLFDEENFAQLDRLGEQYSQHSNTYWDGFETLDFFTTAIEGHSNNTEENHKKWQKRFEKWLKENPKSDLARSSLAQLHIYRAVKVKDKGAASTYKSLIQEANRVMDKDPQLPHRFRKACVPALRLAAIKNENAMDNVVAEANKRWPNYFCVSTWAFRFNNDVTPKSTARALDYVNRRASALGGDEGNKFYARLVAYEFEYGGSYRHPFSKETGFSWERTKKGFEQIFKDYPSCVEARISYLSLADVALDKEAMIRAFDGFEWMPKVKAKTLQRKN